MAITSMGEIIDGSPLRSRRLNPNLFPIIFGDIGNKFGFEAREKGGCGCNAKDDC